MRRVFADTAHYIALLNRRDALHREAAALSAALSDTETVTSDPVFVELFAFVSSAGARTRGAALELLGMLRSDPTVTIVRQTPGLFDAGVDLYRRRTDKAYSLTDCMSMVICRQHHIEEVLTHDRHFEPEGFTILL